MIDRRLAILPDLNKVAIGISHITSQLMAVVIERLGQKLDAFRLPLRIASPDVGDSKI
jgi:hypothetical protein